jgi:hypothetical protein
VKQNIKRLCIALSLSLVALVVVYFAVVFSEVLYLNCDDSFKIEEKEIPVWIKAKVNKELSGYRFIDGKGFAQFDKLILDNKLEHLAHFKIIDNKVQVVVGESSSRCSKMKEALEKILESNKLDDLEFIIYLWDGVHFEQKKSSLLEELKRYGVSKNIPPIFVFAANKIAEDRKRFILIPDPEVLNGSAINKYGWRYLTKKISKINHESPWESKKPLAFWRGGGWSFSGRPYYKRNYAIELSKQYPELLDVKYAPDPNADKSFKERKLKYLYKFFDLDPWASYSKFIEHKMILDLDGNTVSWQGMYWKLFSNSVILKQMTNNELWASDQFIPWVHFIPIREDLTDLIEKIQWVRNNDYKAKQIAEASNNFMRANLMPEQFDMYVYYLLSQYSKLQC